MFHKVFVPVFLLLAFASHSALGVITSMKGPGLSHVIHPDDTFTVTFHTAPPRNAEFYVAFGLNPGTTPPPAGDLGATVLTSDDDGDLVVNGHERTNGGKFKVHLTLPENFSTGSNHKKPYTLTAAVFRVVSRGAAAVNPLIWLGFAHLILFCMYRPVGLGLGRTQRAWISSMTLSPSGLDFGNGLQVLHGSFIMRLRGDKGHCGDHCFRALMLESIAWFGILVCLV